MGPFGISGAIVEEDPDIGVLPKRPERVRLPVLRQVDGAAGLPGAEQGCSEEVPVGAMERNGAGVEIHELRGDPARVRHQVGRGEGSAGSDGDGFARGVLENSLHDETASLPGAWRGIDDRASSVAAEASLPDEVLDREQGAHQQVGDRAAVGGPPAAGCPQCQRRRRGAVQQEEGTPDDGHRPAVSHLGGKEVGSDQARKAFHHRRAPSQGEREGGEERRVHDGWVRQHEPGVVQRRGQREERGTGEPEAGEGVRARGRGPGPEPGDGERRQEQERGAPGTDEGDATDDEERECSEEQRARRSRSSVHDRLPGVAGRRARRREGNPRRSIPGGGWIGSHDPETDELGKGSHPKPLLPQPFEDSGDLLEPGSDRHFRGQPVVKHHDVAGTRAIQDAALQPPQAPIPEIQGAATEGDAGKPQGAKRPQEARVRDSDRRPEDERDDAGLREDALAFRDVRFQPPAGAQHQERVVRLGVVSDIVSRLDDLADEGGVGGGAASDEEEGRGDLLLREQGQQGRQRAGIGTVVEGDGHCASGARAVGRGGQEERPSREERRDQASQDEECERDRRGERVERGRGAPPRRTPRRQPRARVTGSRSCLDEPLPERPRVPARVQAGQQGRRPIRPRAHDPAGPPRSALVHPAGDRSERQVRWLVEPGLEEALPRTDLAGRQGKLLQAGPGADPHPTEEEDRGTGDPVAAVQGLVQRPGSLAGASRNHEVSDVESGRTRGLVCIDDVIEAEGLAEARQHGVGKRLRPELHVGAAGGCHARVEAVRRGRRCEEGPPGNAQANAPELVRDRLAMSGIGVEDGIREEQVTRPRRLELLGLLGHGLRWEGPARASLDARVGAVDAAQGASSLRLDPDDASMGQVEAQGRIVGDRSTSRRRSPGPRGAAGGAGAPATATPGNGPTPRPASRASNSAQARSPSPTTPKSAPSVSSNSVG